VDDLNKTLENYPNLLGKPVEYLLTHLDEIPENIRTDVINFGGGHLNHSMFWLMMIPNSRKQPRGPLKKAIFEQFGSFNKFKDQFNASSKGLFGSGYTWLCLNKDKKLVIVKSKDQDNPISIGLKPILCLDVWEHAYYLKHQNRRIDYIDAWWNVVNWDYVEKNYKEAMA
jgi:superoxide dismutase, Fe-Mn family